MSWLHTFNGLAGWDRWWDVIFIVTVGIMLVWLIALKPSDRAHHGDSEHPLGSDRDCPGCVDWNAR